MRALLLLVAACCEVEPKEVGGSYYTCTGKLYCDQATYAFEDSRICVDSWSEAVDRFNLKVREWQDYQPFQCVASELVGEDCRDTGQICIVQW